MHDADTAAFETGIVYRRLHAGRRSTVSGECLPLPGRYKDDLSLFERIKSRRNGYIIRKEGDRHMAYIFSGMYSVQWYLIEKIDLDVLLQERNVTVPDNMNPGA